MPACAAGALDEQTNIISRPWEAGECRNLLGVLIQIVKPDLCQKNLMIWGLGRRIRSCPLWGLLFGVQCSYRTFFKHGISDQLVKVC